MAIPRLRRAFGVFGDLRTACLVIFTIMLLSSFYFTNKYIGMNIISRVIKANPRNLSQEMLANKFGTLVSTSEMGSYAIGSIGSIYLVISIYGLIGIIAREIHLLLAPIYLLPITAFIMFILIFFNLEIQETSGFLYFWVFTGLVMKIAMIAASIYSFLVVFSYYMDVTVERGFGLPTSTAFPGLDWLPQIPDPSETFFDATESPSKSAQPSVNSFSPKTPRPRPPTPVKTPPPRPPPPNIELPKQ